MFMKDKRRSKLLSIKDLTQEFYKKEKIKKGFNDINNSEWMWGIDMNVEAFAEEGKYQTFISIQ